MSGILQERISSKNKENETANLELNNILTEDADHGSIDKKENYLTEEDISQLNDLDEMMAEENFIAEKKKRKFLHRLSLVFLTSACTYLVVLIYGSFITEFYYNAKGEVAPVIMTVSDISNKNEYNSIVGMYIQSRSLYETLLTLDYRMAAGQEDSMSIAPDYEAALDTVSTLATQIDAAVINSKYTQVKNMISTWVKTHAAAYCQYMSTAITQNDSNAASEAIAARQVLNDNFQLITQNIITLGEDIKGYDLADIKSWSPDGFVQESIEGITSGDSLQTDNVSTETESESESLSDKHSSEQSETQSETQSENIQSNFTLQSESGGDQNG